MNENPYDQQYRDDDYDAYGDFDEYMDLEEDEIYENYDEEVTIGHQGRMRVAAGVTDFFLVILGLVVILLTLTLLITLVNWVINDIGRSFFAIQTNMR